MPTVQVSCEEEYLDLGLPALDTPPSSGEQLTTQLQFRPLHFSNQHYDSAHTNTNWSPDQVTVYTLHCAENVESSEFLILSVYLSTYTCRSIYLVHVIYLIYLI